MNKWNSRKLISAWILTILFTVLLTTGVLDQDNYVKLLGGIWLFWFGGHHMDKRIGNARNNA
jgi:hypothetical protein